MSDMVCVATRDPLSDMVCVAMRDASCGTCDPCVASCVTLLKTLAKSPSENPKPLTLLRTLRTAPHAAKMAVNCVLLGRGRGVRGERTRNGSGANGEDLAPGVAVMLDMDAKFDMLRFLQVWAAGPDGACTCSCGRQGCCVGT
eukprot:364177-Chlamydomonas_euryale.AAC.6